MPFSPPHWGLKYGLCGRSHQKIPSHHGVEPAIGDEADKLEISVKSHFRGEGWRHHRTAPSDIHPLSQEIGVGSTVSHCMPDFGQHGLDTKQNIIRRGQISTVHQVWHVAGAYMSSIPQRQHGLVISQLKHHVAVVDAIRNTQLSGLMNARNHNQDDKPGNVDVQYRIGLVCGQILRHGRHSVVDIL